MAAVQLRVHDRVRDRTLDVDAQPDEKIGEVVRRLVEEHELPQRTVRIGRRVPYALSPPGGPPFDADATVVGAGLTEGAEVELTSPLGKRVWAQVVDLWEGVEDEIRSHAEEQKDALVDQARAQVTEVQERVVGEVEQQARGLVADLTGGLVPEDELGKQGLAAAAGAEIEQRLREGVDEQLGKVTRPVERLEERLKETVQQRVDAVTEKVTGGIEARIEQSRARLLDEFNRRLRGRRATIDVAGRRRAGRKLARIQRSGLFGDRISPMKQSLRSLGSITARRAATVLAVGGAAAAGAAAVTLLPSARLTVAGTATPGVAAAGDGVTLTIEYANRGPDTATDVLIVAGLPPGVSSSDTACGGGTTCVFELASVAPGVQAQVSLEASIAADVPAGLLAVPVEIVDGGKVPGGLSAIAVVDGEPRLLDVQAELDGARADYTITVPAAGEVGEVTAIVPRHTTARAGAPWRCPAGPESGRACTASVAPGARLVFTVDVDRLPGVLEFDPKAAGSRGFDDAVVALAVVEREREMTVEIGARPQGTSIVYTIDYHNPSALAAEAVELSATLPTSAAFDEASSDEGWECRDGVPSKCRLEVGDLAAGGAGQTRFGLSLGDAPAGDLVALDVQLRVDAEIVEEVVVVERPVPALSVFRADPTPASFSFTEGDFVTLCVRLTGAAGDIVVTGTSPDEIEIGDPVVCPADTRELTWTPSAAGGQRVDVTIALADESADPVAYTLVVDPAVSEVAPGDSLWAIAARMLRAELDADPAVPQIAACTSRLAELNRKSYRGPDLIYVDDVIVMPASCLEAP